MERNILTFEVPRSYFSHTDSLLLQLHLTDAQLVPDAKEGAHGAETWTVRRMMDWMEHIAADKEREGHVRTAETYRATVRRTNIQRDILSYWRHKTGQRLSMAWLPEMEELVKRNHEDGQPYLLPIIKRCVADERRAFKTMQYRVNHALKSIGRSLGLPRPLTMYVARHSWASIAQASQVPLPVISAALGHTSERTTRIYLEAIDAQRVDEANERVIAQIVRS